MSNHFGYKKDQSLFFTVTKFNDKQFCVKHFYICTVLIFSETLLFFFFNSFKPNEGVIIIGATNFPEALDKYVLKDFF